VTGAEPPCGSAPASSTQSGTAATCGWSGAKYSRSCHTVRMSTECSSPRTIRIGRRLTISPEALQSSRSPVALLARGRLGDQAHPTSGCPIAAAPARAPHRIAWALGGGLMGPRPGRTVTYSDGSAIAIGPTSKSTINGAWSLRCRSVTASSATKTSSTESPSNGSQKT
jgi:hypothetical protein